MNLEETIDLLTTAAAYDRRTVGKTDAVAWHAAVGDLPFGDAQAAVIGHYTDCNDWLMPGHVRQRVKAMRADRLARHPLPAPDPAIADDTTRYRESLAASIESIADGKQVRRAIGGEKGTGQLSADDMAKLRRRLGMPPAKLTPEETAALQAEASRAEREAKTEDPAA